MKWNFFPRFACCLGILLAAANVRAAVPGLQQQIPAEEYAALVDLYNSTDGPNWQPEWMDNNWWNDPSAPYWDGVTVSGLEYDPDTGAVLKQGNVTDLVLDHKRLKGLIPDTLRNLRSLRSFCIYRTPEPVTGSIPEWLGDLTELEAIGIGNFEQCAPIPESLRKLAKLKTLTLWSSLCGPIPEWLGELGNLEYLELLSNQLTGNIPASLSQLTKLQGLSLNQNLLSGAIPASLSGLDALGAIDLSQNELSGSIPSSFGNLRNLQNLVLSHNHLSGEIPATLGNLKNLGSIVVADNQLSGSVPASFANLAKLQWLDVSDNQLGPSLPDFSVTAPDLIELDIRSNCFAVSPGTQVGGVMQRLIARGEQQVYYEPQNEGCAYDPTPGLQNQIPAAEYAALIDFYLDTQGPSWTRSDGWNNPSAASWYGVTVSGFDFDVLTGEVRQVGSVTALILPQNGLRGAIPSSIGACSNLQFFLLSGNELGGAIPASLGNATSLKLINLNGTQLIGSIPETMGNLVNLEDLRLAENQLSGNIPMSLGRLVHLRNLDLIRNRLSGSIPSTFGNLVELESLNLSQNQLSGPIPDCLANLGRLAGLGLSDNLLEGSIPASLGNLPNLESLGLGNNRLTGTIPESLGNLQSLWALVLARNELTGSIPASFAGLPILYFDVSYNQLTGSIPEGFASGDDACLFTLNVEHNQLSGLLPNFTRPWRINELKIAYNCFDISPRSPVRAVVHDRYEGGIYPWNFSYKPQNLGCGPVAPGDFNNDGCVDQRDLVLLMNQVRARSGDLNYDLNGDGKVDVADARYLALHFTNLGGVACDP